MAPLAYPQRFQRFLAGVSGPFGNRGERVRSGQYAHTASPKVNASWCRTPRLCRAITKDFADP
jgi:hypothetical protein